MTTIAYAIPPVNLKTIHRAIIQVPPDPTTFDGALRVSARDTSKFRREISDIRFS